jgi:hypothetical protein
MWITPYNGFNGPTVVNGDYDFARNLQNLATWRSISASQCHFRRPQWHSRQEQGRPALILWADLPHILKLSDK